MDKWGRASLQVLFATLLGVGGAGAQDVPEIPWYRLQEAAAKAAALGRHTRSPVLATTPAALPIDVTFYDLDLRFDPALSRVAGSVAIEARVGAAPLTSVLLDLDSEMVVDSVSVGGAPAAFAHSTDDLVVQLGHSYAPGEPLRVVVSYAGIPGPANGLHFQTHAGQPFIWNLSEPFGARTWWPCQDTPADKADSLDADLTVPVGLTAIGNGTLAGTTSAGGWTTFAWRERHPIVPYLVSIAAHPYVSFAANYPRLAGGVMPVTFWSFADQAGLAQPLLPTAVAVLQRYASLFGEYPFADEKYAVAQFGWGGGMEHQTATSVCCWSRLLLAHETAHQWFGDAVTCQNFGHVWLNEGLATYSEALWDEASGGLAAYRTNIWDNRWYGNGTILVPSPETASFGRIFDANLSYNKASWVPHMLRGMFGDATFFAFLQAYIADPSVAYGTATTADFQAVAERVGGRNLDNFFQRWIETPYFPTYLYDWNPAPGNGAVELSIEQIQTQGLYTMPIRVRVTTTAGDADFVVEDSLAQQTFTLPVGAPPQAVSIDPEHWILCTTEPAVRDPSFARGILVVNGAAWSLGNELASAYDDSVFSGGLPFSFWDEGPAPSGGYPSGLPAPLGHGGVPSETLDKYSSVVWVGDADLDLWNQASIVSYLRAGGNVLFLGRRGQEFLHPSRAARLGLRWAEVPGATLAAATAASAGFVGMTVTGAQTDCAVFETGFDLPETSLLLTESQTFGVPRGIAAWRHPPAGGTLRADGGQFAFVSGRPYRWEHGALRANVATILLQLFGESPVATGTPPPTAWVTRLLDPAPNPFNPSVQVRWQLAAPERVRLRVYTPSGRLVRTLLDAPRAAGPGRVTWDGRDERRVSAASGVYLLRFEAGAVQSSAKLQLVR